MVKNLLEYAVTPDSNILVEIQYEDVDGLMKTVVEIIDMSQMPMSSTLIERYSSVAENYAKQFFSNRNIGLYAVRRKNIMFG